ncbi:hypothetical protein NLJ89_g2895 [Agrocybe chaxingu]|uniref:Isomerase YbhE n=1 Tax=Agrocybe chaxingu TaxID=84603 RepID=A0A9W8K6M5_9AGAR|nr:hypothetical protein NLJ89_g2895 [Agrocybe chaxingu]
MVSFTILAGGYDFFVATYLFNAATSSLTVTRRSPTGQSPSWLSLHPTNQSLLYAVNEVAVGAVQSFSVSSTGELSQAIDTVSSGGDSPAFATALSTGAVAVVNYFGGNGRIIPTSNSVRFDNTAPIITFPIINGPETVSHPHMVLEHRDEVLVPDLGQDTIWRLKKGASGEYAIQGSIPQPKGSGPRHIAIFNDRLFTLHELSSTLSVQSIPRAPNGTVTTFATSSIIPPNPPAGAVFQAAEILIPKPTKRFPKPYIYVSNRNTAPGTQTAQGDSIAIFEHVNRGKLNEGLVLVKQVFTGLNQIRGMEFGNTENGGEEFLVASGVAGNAGVIVLKRTERGRSLEIVARNLDIPTRTSFVWL